MQKVEAAPVSDVDVLNIEYLEAEFYAVATYGATSVELGAISSSDQTGPTTGGQIQVETNPPGLRRVLVIKGISRCA